MRVESIVSIVKARISQVALLLMVVLAPAGVAAQTESVEHYGLDALGSVRIVFDGSGAVKKRIDYEPFGAEVVPAPGVPKEKFAGLFRDEESGLDYAQARMYQRPGFHRVKTVSPFRDCSVAVDVT